MVTVQKLVIEAPGILFEDESLLSLSLAGCRDLLLRFLGLLSSLLLTPCSSSLPQPWALWTRRDRGLAAVTPPILFPFPAGNAPSPQWHLLPSLLHTASTGELSGISSSLPQTHKLFTSFLMREAGSSTFKNIFIGVSLFYNVGLLSIGHQSKSVIYIYPIFYGFAPHSGHHQALSGVSCALRQVLISCLFYVHVCSLASVGSNSLRQMQGSKE